MSKSTDLEQEYAQDLRAALLAFCDFHEALCPGDGKPCWSTRASTLAFLAHSLGFNTPERVAKFDQFLEDYNTHCRDAKCSHNG